MPAWVEAAAVVVGLDAEPSREQWALVCPPLGRLRSAMAQLPRQRRFAQISRHPHVRRPALDRFSSSRRVRSHHRFVRAPYLPAPPRPLRVELRVSRLLPAASIPAEAA